VHGIVLLTGAVFFVVSMIIYFSKDETDGAKALELGKATQGQLETVSVQIKNILDLLKGYDDDLKKSASALMDDDLRMTKINEELTINQSRLNDFHKTLIALKNPQDHKPMPVKVEGPIQISLVYREAKTLPKVPRTPLLDKVGITKRGEAR